MSKIIEFPESKNNDIYTDFLKNSLEIDTFTIDKIEHVEDEVTIIKATIRNQCHMFMIFDLDDNSFEWLHSLMLDARKEPTNNWGKVKYSVPDNDDNDNYEYHTYVIDEKVNVK